MRRWAILVAAILAAGAAGGQTTPPASGVKPVRVGFVCPATGGSADFGIAARLGAELAAKEINEVGGFLGRPIQLVIRDDAANPDKGRAAAEDLVLREKVDFTVGYCNTGVALKALDVFQDNRHLLLVPVATGTAVTAKYPARSSYIFRVSPRDALQAAAIVQELVGRKGLTKIAVFADRTGYGEGGLKDVENNLAERKLAPVYVARFDLGVSSLVAEVQAARAAGAQAIVGYTVSPELATLVRARQQVGFAVPVVGPWPLSFRTVWDATQGAAEGAMMVQSIIQDLSNERRTSFIARLRRHAGQQTIGSLMAAAQTYDAVHLMMRALFQTRGDTGGDALKHALENLEKPYAGVVTSYDRPFAADDHDAMTMNMIWFGVWRKGEIHFAYDSDARRASYIRRKEKGAPAAAK